MQYFAAFSGFHPPPIFMTYFVLPPYLPATCSKTPSPERGLFIDSETI